MEYKIKSVDIDKYYDRLLAAYYSFFEKLYGKYPVSYIIHKKLENGSRINPSYVFMDSNLSHAREVVKSSKDNHEVVMIGAYDENEILAAVSRIRRVIEPSGAYVCISEILPLIEDDLDIITNVIKSIEVSLEGYNVGDFMSFEVPTGDLDFQNALLGMGYDLVPSKKETQTVLYDKKIEKNLGLK